MGTIICKLIESPCADAVYKNLMSMYILLSRTTASLINKLLLRMFQHLYKNLKPLFLALTFQNSASQLKTASPA